MATVTPNVPSAAIAARSRSSEYHPNKKPQQPKPERSNIHDLRNRIDQSLLRRPHPPFLPCPAAGAGPADLCPPATGADHRQPGTASYEPLPLPPCRRVRRPQVAGKLRRQSDQGLAELLPPPPGLRPDDG